MDLGTDTCTFEEIHVKEMAQAIVGADKSEIRRAGSGCCREAEFLLQEASTDWGRPTHTIQENLCSVSRLQGPWAVSAEHLHGNAWTGTPQ